MFYKLKASLAHLHIYKAYCSRRRAAVGPYRREHVLLLPRLLVSDRRIYHPDYSKLYSRNLEESVRHKLKGSLLFFFLLLGISDDFKHGCQFSKNYVTLTVTKAKDKKLLTELGKKKNHIWPIMWCEMWNVIVFEFRYSYIMMCHRFLVLNAAFQQSDVMSWAYQAARIFAFTHSVIIFRLLMIIYQQSLWVHVFLKHR